MPLDALDKGDKVSLHMLLYEREVAVLDRVCAEYNCSRAAAVGALIDKYASTELTPAISPGKPGARGRRSPPRT